MDTDRREFSAGRGRRGVAPIMLRPVVLRHLFIGAILALADLSGLADQEPQRPKLWFPVGETLLYEMHWGIIPVGATVVSSRWVEEEGQKRLAIRFVTRTNRLCDKFYKVDDIVEAVIDPASFLPIRFTKKLHEGDFRSDEITTFDYVALKARWVSRLDDRSLEYDIGPDTRDIISFMYMMRQHQFEPGDKGTYRVAGDEGLTEILVQVEDWAKIDIPLANNVRSVRIKPSVKSDSLFARKVPRMVWVSVDERRLLLRMVVKVPVGHITMDLAEVTVVSDAENGHDAVEGSDAETTDDPQIIQMGADGE